MVGWHHRLNGYEFEQAPGDGEGQGSLVSYSPWGHKEPDTTWRLNKNKEGVKRFCFLMPSVTSWFSPETLPL